MGVHVEAGRQPCGSDSPDQPAGRSRVPSAEPPQSGLRADLEPTRGRVAPFGTKHPLESADKSVLGRRREDVRRCALHHRHQGGSLRQGRDERDRRRSAADHHHPAVGDIEILRPPLRVHNCSSEPLQPVEPRQVTGVVAEIARRGEHPAACQLQPSPGIGPLDVHAPAGVPPGPGDRSDPVVQPDMLVDTALCRRIPDIAQNLGGRRQHDRLAPGPVGVAQRDHVRVRPNAGIPKQVPRSARRSPRLDDDIAQGRALPRQPACHTDPGQASTHNDDVIRLARVGHPGKSARACSPVI